MDRQNKKSKRKPKNRGNKVHLVFDVAKRREFLTGFHKRKLLRKKQAQELFEKELKEERKRLKADARESYKKLIVSHRDIPELENLLNEEYDEEDVTVKVVELNANDIAKENNWIGINQPKYDDKEDYPTRECKDESEEIPGMELKTTKQEKKADVQKFESAKQIKKELKKQATKNIKKSKVFQRKNKLEQLKQKKHSFKQKQQRESVLQKTSKGRKHRR